MPADLRLPTAEALRTVLPTPGHAPRYRVSPRGLLAAALGVGALLRLGGLDRQSLWTDELYVVWQAQQPLAVLLDPRIHIQHPPGYRLALAVWTQVSREEGWLHLLPALTGWLVIPVVWALARALWPHHPATALIAAGLTATAPFLLHYSQDVTAYSWTLLWVTGSALLLLWAWRDDRGWLWAAWAGSLVVALYSHYFSIFPILVEVGAVVIMGFWSKRRAPPRVPPRRRHAGLALGAAALLYTPWVGVLLTAGRDALTGQHFLPLPNTQPLRWLPLLVAGFGHPTLLDSRGAWLLTGAVLAGAALWGLWQMPRVQGSWAKVGFLAAWAGAALLGPYLFLRWTMPPDLPSPVRFAAFALPALVLGGAAIIARLPRRAQAGIATAWLALVVVQWSAELTAPPRQDWRGLLGTVAAQAQPGDALLAFSAFHAGAAAAYYPIPMPVQGGWFAAAGPDPTGAAYWLPVGWQYRGFLNTQAAYSADLAGEFARRWGAAPRLWYLAGDGVDGTYPPSPAAERVLAAAGWRAVQEWPASPLVLRLYVRGGAQEMGTRRAGDDR